MPHYKDIAGMRFGKLLAIECVGRDAHNFALWRCQCDCGNQTIVTASSLVTGHTQSCGCLMRESNSKQFTKHGESSSRLYIVWSGMINRCENPSHKSYQYYGGRGIKVCDEWRTDFMAFKNWAVANGYDDEAQYGDCTIDRIDVNGDYEPNNCRWVDNLTQARNKRPRKRGYKRGKYKKCNHAIKGENDEMH